MGTAAGTSGTVSGVSSNVPDTLLLDEMFSPAIATDLATRGIDCRAVDADPVLRALSDLEIFQAASADNVHYVK
jgi:predicted nuclease of predicted toxin-antitoxin system